MSLAIRNILFSIVVPGAGGVYVPWLILTRDGASPAPAAWYAIPVIAAGVGTHFPGARASRPLFGTFVEVASRKAGQGPRPPVCRSPAGTFSSLPAWFAGTVYRSSSV